MAEYSFSGTHVYSDIHGRPYWQLNDEKQVSDFYENVQKKFWGEVRNNTNDHAKKIILSEQQEDYSSGPKKTLSLLLELFILRRKIKNLNNISILEIGCANGTTLRHLSKFFADLDVTFTGIELTNFLVDDLLEHFPDARAHAGGAEEFVAMTESDFGQDRFDVFLASCVFCQMPPNVVYDVLSKASKHCDTVLLWDFFVNIDGQLSAESPIMFKHTNNAKNAVFANPYRLFLEKLGYVVEEICLSHGVADGFFVPETGALLATRQDSSA